MQILAVDVGTGTQDALLYDTEREPENALKLVMPSPTVLVAEAIRAATRAGQHVLLHGVTMGGGPCAWAAEEHLKAGRQLWATPDAARTFNDDQAEVEAMGVRVVGKDEARALKARAGVRALEMRDFDYGALDRAFAAFGVDLGQADVLAAAVFDHGAAPPGVSDRAFRFAYLAERIQGGAGLAGFAFAAGDVPASMTRLQAVEATAPAGRPLVIMDTAPAAVLGALEDPMVSAQEDLLVANVGNFHALAFHLRRGHIAGLFEHHTGLLSREHLEALLRRLHAGTLTNEELFADHGHGALVTAPAGEAARTATPRLAVTGPRRGLLAGSELQPYLAVPHGDMMMAGCWGLVRACASVLPWTAGAIEAGLGPAPGQSAT
jgi:uncharacterized protein (DUF1786 family)